MADILIQPTVPSLFTHAESASSLIVDSPTADSNNNTNILHSRSSPNHSNNNINNQSNNSHSANKYVGHVSRLRSVFSQYALTLNDLKSGEHRSRYSNHHQGLASPTRDIINGMEDRSLSPILPTTTLPLATTSSSTIIERSRSLSNPRILDNTASQMHMMRSGLSSLTVAENQSNSNGTGASVPNSTDDHAIRFRRAKEMFQTLEEEAARTVVSSSTLVGTKPSVNHRSPDHFSHESYQPDLMHEGSKTHSTKTTTEHIPDLIIDHRQQQQQQQQQQQSQRQQVELHEFGSNRIREIPVQIIATTPSPSPTSSDRSYISVPIHRATPPILQPSILSSCSSTMKTFSNDDVPYAMVHRKEFHSDQHYDFPKDAITDFPADAIEQHRKHQHQSDSNLDHPLLKPSNEEIANRIVASILPSNILKRMDHLNTKFIKPAAMDQPLPKLSFQETTTESSTIEKDEDSNGNYQTIESLEEDQNWIENPMLNEVNEIQASSRSSSPIFYEKPGIPQLNEDDENGSTVSPNGSRRVKFSNDPIRVYPTYSPSEYNRRNDDIDPFSASAEYELEKRIEKMDVFEVEVQKGPDGLGISVLGMGVGADSGLEKLGIFVKSLNPQGVIARDGRIQVGDQIIDVDDHSLVGVTHTYATSVLKATSGLVRFRIGREKDVENSEILRLIQQSLQMDQERNEMSRALQHNHDTFHDPHLNDDGFPNLELNDHDDQETITETTIKDTHHPFPGVNDKNYDTWPASIDKMNSHASHDMLQFEILKQRYESLENTLANVEKEKQHYQDLYEKMKKDFEHIEEKYLKAKKLIKELQDREIELRDNHNQQLECNELQQRKIKELIKKNEELERTVANSMNQQEKIHENGSHLIRNSKLPSNSTECVVSRPPDIPDRIPIRSRTSSGQPIVTNERPPSRNTPSTSSVRLTPSSTDKVSNSSPNNRLNHQSDFEVDRSPLLNHSIQIDKTQLAKTRFRQLPSKRLSNPTMDEDKLKVDEIEIKTYNQKLASSEFISSRADSYELLSSQLVRCDQSDIRIDTTNREIPTETQPSTAEEFIEVKDWTLDQCIQWLTAQEMTSFIPIFLNRNIDGEKLLLLDSSKMKTMGIKSSKDRDHLKMKLKELKHAELDRIRERLLTQQPTTFQHPSHSGNRLRSSSMTKLRERRLFGGSVGK